MIALKIKKLLKMIAPMLIVSLTGCMMGPDFQKPVIETPDQESKKPVSDEKYPGKPAYLFALIAETHIF